MEKSDLYSQEEPIGLSLSQESYRYFWGLLDEAEIAKYMANNSELSDMENESYQMENLNDNVPASTSSATDSRECRNLNVPHKNLSTITEEHIKDEYSETTALPQQVNVSNIPPCTDWPGDYDFNISFQSQEKTTKNTSWIYSDIKEKLYVNMAVPCPINVHVKSSPPFGSIIRAMPIFSRSEHITDVVRRCLNHSNPTDALNEGHSAPSHLIRCDNSSSQYVEDVVTKRQSVTTLFENPQAGMEYTPYLYRFMCLGSCVGGLNRRPIKVIFTLEKDGCCLGRKVIDLRICACPGRDKRMDEKQIEKQQLKRNSSHPKFNLDGMSGPSPKKLKSDSGDEESCFTITVHRRSHYELLIKMKDVLEMASLLTPEQLAAHRQRRHGKPVSSLGTKLSASVQSSSSNISSADSVESWLYSIGMVAYVDCFKSCGYTCMEQLNMFKEEDLKKMRIGSRHKSKILKALLKYQENIPCS